MYQFVCPTLLRISPPDGCCYADAGVRLHRSITLDGVGFISAFDIKVAAGFLGLEN